jgi:hypothetical protein
MTKPYRIHPNLKGLTPAEARDLALRGYVPRSALFNDEFANAFAEEIDSLIAQAVIRPSADRMVKGVPTEWIANLGIVARRGPEAEIFKISPLLADLYAALQEFGESFSQLRAVMIETGCIGEDEVQELAVEGMELNVNRVIGAREAVWTGLHLHTDDARFSPALRALDISTIAHDAVRARAFTVSGYARRRGENGAPLNDMGGALPFFVRSGARNPGDQAVFDIIPADHNAGAFFFPKTVHGVSRMVEGGVRYSFQAFFPSARAWRKIKARIAANGDPDSEAITEN